MRGNRMGWSGLGAVLIGLGLAAQAQAEVLQVSGVYPAASDAAAVLQSIAVERFGGQDGAALSIRIEDALRAVGIDGQRYFNVVPAGLTRDAQGVLRGTATAELEVTSTTRKREKCVKRDQDNKCIEKAKVDVVCFEREIELGLNLRLIGRNGDLLWSDDRPETVETSYCEDDSSKPPSPETMVRELVDKAAARVRFALAPEFRREAVRVLEDRKGLSRADADRFKLALRLTKSDPAQACREWQAIAAANPNHAASVFNTGLCAESQSDLELAERRYRTASQLSRASAIAQAETRLAARSRALAQLEAHRRGDRR